MRYPRLFIALLPLLLACGAATARAQASGVDHVTLMEGELAPGAERVYQLKFGEGALRQGWLFGLAGQIRAGDAELTLLDPGGAPAASWRWQASDATRWDGIAIPRDGDYSLRVASVGAATLRYALYYDQSCFCVGKKMPLEGGIVIFQGSAAPGTPVEAWLGINGSMETSVQVAYRGAPAGRWPDDYRILPITPKLDSQSDTFRQESISFTADTPDPYYVIVQSRKGTGGISFLTQEGGAAGSAQLTPAPERHDWLLVVAAAAALVAGGALALAARAWLRRGRVTSDG